MDSAFPYGVLDAWTHAARLQGPGGDGLPPRCTGLQPVDLACHEPEQWLRQLPRGVQHNKIPRVAQYLWTSQLNLGKGAGNRRNHPVHQRLHGDGSLEPAVHVWPAVLRYPPAVQRRPGLSPAVLQVATRLARTPPGRMGNSAVVYCAERLPADSRYQRRLPVLRRVELLQLYQRKCPPDWFHPGHVVTLRRDLKRG